MKKIEKIQVLTFAIKEIENNKLYIWIWHKLRSKKSIICDSLPLKMKKLKIEKIGIFFSSNFSPVLCSKL